MHPPSTSTDNFLRSCLSVSLIGPKRHNLPWLNQHIIRGICKRNSAFQKFKKSPNYNSAKRYKVLRNSVTSIICKSRATYFKNINPANKKQFWKTIKYINKQRSTIPTLSVSNVSASTDSTKATLLNDYFSSRFNTAVPPLAQQSDEHQPSYCPDDLLCIEDEVAALIRSLDISKATGLDGISARMLKGTVDSIVPSLTKLFNISIKAGQFPQCWKESSIVPIPKGGDHSNPGNYQPISLLSITSKLLECHYYWLLTEHLSSSCPLAPNQWEFQHGVALGSQKQSIHA